MKLCVWWLLVLPNSCLFLREPCLPNLLRLVCRRMGSDMINGPWKGKEKADGAHFHSILESSIKGPQLWKPQQIRSSLRIVSLLGDHPASPCVSDLQFLYSPFSQGAPALSKHLLELGEVERLGCCFAIKKSFQKNCCNTLSWAARLWDFSRSRCFPEHWASWWLPVYWSFVNVLKGGWEV